jgi:subtilase family serine protease
MGSSRFPRSKALGGLLAGATALAVIAMAGPALAAPQGRHPLHGSTPRWLHQAHDLGTTSSSQQVNFGVLLGMRDEADAVATLQAVSDPSSASYGQWLSNAAFNSRYAPASSDVAAVQSWLRS